MLRKLGFIVITLAFLFGCATKSTVTLPSGDVYAVKSKHDSLVEFQDGEKKIVVDNRGRPGMIEQVLGAIFVNLPDVKVGD